MEILSCRCLHGSPSLALTLLLKPVNVTVPEGESIRINCTSTMSSGIAIWIIDGLQYYWTDFKSIDQYTFNRTDNSLTVNNSPRTLDGTSYQCVLNQQESNIGYMTVLYELPSSTPSSTTESEISTSDVVQPFTSSSTLSKSSTVTNTIEPPSTSRPRLIHWPVVIASTSVGGTMLSVFIVCCCIVFVRRSFRSKSSVTAAVPVEHFDMVKNEIYETKAKIKMARNSAYSHPNHYFQEP